MRFNLISPAITFSTERKYSVNVGDDDNDQTTIKVPVFENGHPEAVLKWRKHFDELIELKLLTSRQKFNNAALLLTGEAKEHWEDSKLSTEPFVADQRLNEEHYQEAMTTFMAKYFSVDTATDLRDFLHYVKKPNNMTVENFIRRVKELNRYLILLPPPLNVSLTDEELFAVIKRSVPSWNNNFRTANLRNQITTVQELTEYYTDLEEIEYRRNNNNNNNRNNNNNQNKSPAGNHRNNNNRNGTRNNNNNNNSNNTRRHPNSYCHRHETSNHSWYECRLNPRSSNYDPNAPQPRNERQGNRNNNNRSNNQNNNNNNGNRNQQRNNNNNGNNNNGNNHNHPYNTRSRNNNNNQHQNRTNNQNNNNNQHTGHYHMDNPQAGQLVASRHTTFVSNNHSNNNQVNDNDSLYMFSEYFPDDPRPTLPPTISDMVPELRFTFANTNNSNNQMYLLLDTGATRSIIDATCVPNTAEIFPDPIGTRTFTTKAGTFTTTHLTKLQLCFPDLAPKRYFNITLHIDNSHRHSSFNAILGRDMLRHIGIGFNFANEPPTIQLDNYNLPMTLRASINHFHPLSTLQQAEKDFEEKLALLPAEYRRADLRSIIPSHLNVTQQNQLHGILQQYSDLFEGKLGSLPGSPVSLQLKPNSTPYCSKAVEGGIE
jgi:hypothetical protein